MQEQARAGDQRLAWVLRTPPSWWADVANDHQRERWLLPTVRGEMEECYAITEEGAGSDVSDLTGDRTSRRRRVRPQRREVARHVVQRRDYVFFQGVLTDGPHAGDQALFVRRQRHAGRARRPHAGVHAHHRAPHPIVAFEDVRVPASTWSASEGDGMSFAYEWFRFERLMVAARCLGAAERLVDEATAFARSGSSAASR